MPMSNACIVHSRFGQTVDCRSCGIGYLCTTMYVNIILWPKSRMTEPYGQSVNMEYMTLRHPGPVQKVKVTLLKNIQVFVACSNTILYWYSLHATVILTRLMFADLLIMISQTARSEFVWRGNEAYQPFPFSALTLRPDALLVAQPIGWATRRASGLLKSWVLVCWWWWFDLCFSPLVAAVTALSPTPPIIISSNKIQNGDILVLANPGSPGKIAVKMETERERKRHINIYGSFLVVFYVIAFVRHWIKGLLTYLLT